MEYFSDWLDLAATKRVVWLAGGSADGQVASEEDATGGIGCDNYDVGSSLLLYQR